jgi:dolichol-phosphate mannosyltransferase
MAALVIVPTYDERDTIATLLSRLLADGREVLVIDDGSPDGTGEVVARMAATEPRLGLLARTSKDGLGEAYRAGYERALASEHEVVCQMDADLSHDPGQLGALLDAIAAGADVAIGSRYVPGGDVRGWSWHRVALSRAANRYVRLASACPVRDATAGFRAYRSSALRHIGVDATMSDGYAFQIEMTLRAHQAGLVVKEEPITFVEREHGRSKLSGAVSREAFVSVLRWSWRLRRGLPL